MLFLSSPLFGYGCTIAAFFLFWTSNPEYRLCLKIMFLEFLFCQFASIYGLELTRNFADWQIYAAYSLVQFIAVLSLFIAQWHKNRISIIIALSISIAGLINAELALSWLNQGLTSFSAKEIYNIYPYLFTFIMFIQLLFMLLCNKQILRPNKNGDSYSGFINVAFLVYPRANARNSCGVVCL